jgi:hypothetical protein
MENKVNDQQPSKYSKRIIAAVNAILSWFYSGLAGLIYGGLIIAAVGILCWLLGSLPSALQSFLPSNHDTPVWINGDWMIGEYRICEMRNKINFSSGSNNLTAPNKLPLLFCGEGTNGLYEFWWLVEKSKYDKEKENKKSPESDNNISYNPSEIIKNNLEENCLQAALLGYNKLGNDPNDPVGILIKDLNVDCNTALGWANKSDVFNPHFFDVTSGSLNHRFHVLSVRYFGKIDRTDKAIISWRCQRLSSMFGESPTLECKAID